MKICLKNVSLLVRNIGGFYSENIWIKRNLSAYPVLSCFFRHFMAGASTSQQNSTVLNEKPFTPKKALILTKFSRYEFEKRTHSELSEEELIKNLEDRGSDYNNLLQHHQIHVKNRDLVVKTLQDQGIETKVVNRFEYSDSYIDWADVIFTTGGDGTYLMAASKIKNRDKPLIGINSDPTRSLGHLCLPSFYTENFPEAVIRLKAGNFRWMLRQRIKISISGENAFDPPIELHDQQLQYPEYRFLDCVEGHHKSNSPKVPKLEKCTKPKCMHELPVRALNEVFIGECLSSRVSYYELAINSSPKEKLKSSGLTVCTGTGSTSWSFNINKVTEQCVKHLLKIRMGFKCKPRGFAEKIEIKSRMFDACLVIDGGLSFAFNDGATAILEISDDDALLTVTLPDQCDKI
ncbi:NAD kinase 2, mitochondrial [Nephila pilipes]|uniref:NAD kinase 2, mitochondrial n=1 Tax=Nephila pilipes TaxID=299642 RepID=A0A8X6TK36_NEPPI|nr:NAD kinase 2, mitochondrial [Nephila pilipes]